jgi:hypothetical protein
MAVSTGAPDTEAPSTTLFRQTPEGKPAGVLPFGYAATIFLSAFLLFQVQLLIGKYLLPFFGGAPAVWNICLLYFQVLLLGGYAYAHFVAGQSRLRIQGRIHALILLVCLAVFIALWVRWGTPLTPGGNWLPAPGADPVGKILQLLGVTVALPFFVLSTTGPLLQHWFSSCHEGKTPYRFYALSNAGSLAGLLSYPFLVEWTLTTKQQARLWSAGFIFFAVFCGWIVGRLPDTLQSTRAEPSPTLQKTRWPAVALWLGLSACSSMMLLATTNLLGQDIAPIPLLWVLPLSLYLLSFILTFESDRWYRRDVFQPFYFLLLGLGLKTIFQLRDSGAARQIAVFSTALFAVCMICHGELARSKPIPQRLTSFYFALAGGGALGGLFAALVAPAVFRGFWEFPTALVGCGFLLFLAYVLEERNDQTNRAAWTASLAILSAFLIPQLSVLWPRAEASRFFSNEYYTGSIAAGALFVFWLIQRRRSGVIRTPDKDHFPWQPAATLAATGIIAVIVYAHTLFGKEYILLQERNFFGVKTVQEDMGSIDFLSGNILHGGELKDPANRHTPTFYYSRSTGIGLLLSNFPRGTSLASKHLRVGLIGLGVGTLAAYGQTGDQFRFYDIDPAVIQLSLGQHPYFHFLQDSPATIAVVPGDARLSLQSEAARGELQNFDVLVLDAFSSDAIPVHLLTREAMGVYLRHLRGPNSVIGFHVSNRYLDLRPVVQALCDSYGLRAVQVKNSTARWILASRNPDMVRLPNLAEAAKPVELIREPLLWTDDYSNLVLILRRPNSSW